MKEFKKIQILTALIIGMLSIGLLTWGIGKVYLEIVSHSGRAQSLEVQSMPKESDSSAKNILVLPEVRFWTCQIGLFQSESNARSCVEKLQVLGYHPEILGSAPWAVCLGWGRSATELAVLRQSLAAQNIESMPKQMILPERRFRVAGNNTQFTINLLSSVSSILQEGASAEILAQEQQIWDTQAGEHPSKELAGLHQFLNQIRQNGNDFKQISWGLSLYFDFQMIINRFSGK